MLLIRRFEEMAIELKNRKGDALERGTPLNNSIGTGTLVQSELACNPEKRGKK